MRRQLDTGLLVAVLLALFAVWPLLTPGMPNTADGPIHFYRAVDMQQAWQDGVLYPRWSANLALGYGTPLFDFAPPLLYLAMMVLNQLGLDLALAMKLVVILFVFIAAIGMYVLGRDTLGREAGWVSAAAYLYAPYRLRELYIQGNYAQFLGLASYPLILWAFFHVIESGRLRWTGVGGISLAVLLLSHNISAMIFAPLLAVYIVFWLILQRGRGLRPLRDAVLTGLLGLGLSAFFWLPAFYESRWIQLSLITKGHFDFRLNFLSLPELFAPYTALDFSAVNVHLPRSLGWAMIALALLGLAAAVWGRGLARHQRWLVVLSVVLLAACTFMMLPASTPLWENVPLLKLAEFPWRILGIAAVPLALAAGAGAKLLGAVLPRRSGYWGAPLALLGILIPSLFYLFPQQPFVDLSGAQVKDITAYELRTKAFGTTSAGEFLPLWTTQHPTDSPMVADYKAGRLPDKIDRTSLPADVQVQETGRGYSWNGFRFQADRPFTARFNTLWFPGWQATLDGQPVDAGPQSPTGLIELDVPAGTHTVRLSFGTTLPRVLADAISAIALLALLGLGVRGVLRRQWAARDAAQEAAPAPVGPSALWPSIGALLVLLVVWQGGVRPLTGWFRVQSLPGQVVGVQHPARVRLADQAVFLGYDLEASDRVTPGQTIVARVYWQATPALGTDYRSFVHLDALPDLKTVAQSDAMHPGGIPMTTWPPSMYAQDEHALTLPADLPPGMYLLRAGLYDPSTGRRLPALDENGHDVGDAVLLQGMRVERASPLRVEDLPRTPAVRFGDAIELVSHAVAAGDGGATVTLYWRARQPLVQEYTVFVHVLDATGQVVAQADGVPCGGRYPTIDWLPGEIVEDVHRVALPAGAAGPFHVAIGLFDPITSVRLEARDEKGSPLAEDRLVVADAVR